MPEELKHDPYAWAIELDRIDADDNASAADKDRLTSFIPDSELDEFTSLSVRYDFLIDAAAEEKAVGVLGGRAAVNALESTLAGLDTHQQIDHLASFSPERKAAVAKLAGLAILAREAGKE